MCGVLNELDIYPTVWGKRIAPAVELTKTKMFSGNIKLNLISYRRDNPCGCPTQAPSDEGAVIFRRKMTEGEKQ